VTDTSTRSVTGGKGREGSGCDEVVGFGAAGFGAGDD